jgi:hypothetical protein
MTESHFEIKKEIKTKEELFDMICNGEVSLKKRWFYDGISEIHVVPINSKWTKYRYDLIGCDVSFYDKKCFGYTKAFIYNEKLLTHILIETNSNNDGDLLDFLIRQKKVQVLVTINDYFSFDLSLVINK